MSICRFDITQLPACLEYATVGTVQNQIEEIYMNIAKACNGMNVQLLIALGSKDYKLIEEFEGRCAKDLPKGTILVAYAP